MPNSLQAFKRWLAQPNAAVTLIAHYDVSRNGERFPIPHRHVNRRRKIVSVSPSKFVLEGGARMWFGAASAWKFEGDVVKNVEYYRSSGPTQCVMEYRLELLPFEEELMITIYQRQNPTFDADMDAAKLAWAAKDYKEVAKVRTDDLEVAYHATNTISGPWWENSIVKVIVKTRSTSMGDIARTPNGKYHLCMSVGWQEIELPTANVVSYKDAGDFA